MDKQALRDQNLETIKAFLALGGPERGQARAPLFTQDAVKEMALPGQAPMVKSAATWLAESAREVPEWAFYENEIYQTDDPNVFLVKSVGRGNALFTGEAAVYINYYINEFVMDSGKIKRFRETFNPCEKYHR